MSMPRNSHYDGPPGVRSPDIPPNPYQGGLPGQRSPWGHSSPRPHNSYKSPRNHNRSQSTPSSQWSQSPSPRHPRFTPPHMPNFSPISHRPPFQTPHSNNRGSDCRNRSFSGGGNTPYGGDRRQGQKPYNKDRRHSGGGNWQTNNKHNYAPDIPINAYVKRDMLENPWAQLEREEKSSAT